MQLVAKLDVDEHIAERAVDRAVIQHQVYPSCHESAGTSLLGPSRNWMVLVRRSARIRKKM